MHTTRLISILAAVVISVSSAPVAKEESIEKLCKGSRNGYRAFKGDCSKFVLCLDDRPFTIECPKGLIWSDTFGYCDLPMRTVCPGDLFKKAVTPSTSTTEADVSSGDELEYDVDVLGRVNGKEHDKNEENPLKHEDDEEKKGEAEMGAEDAGEGEEGDAMEGEEKEEDESSEEERDNESSEESSEESREESEGKEDEDSEEATEEMVENLGSKGGDEDGEAVEEADEWDDAKDYKETSEKGGYENDINGEVFDEREASGEDDDEKTVKDILRDDLLSLFY